MSQQKHSNQDRERCHLRKWNQTLPPLSEIEVTVISPLRQLRIFLKNALKAHLTSKMSRATITNMSQFDREDIELKDLFNDGQSCKAVCMWCRVKAQVQRGSRKLIASPSGLGP